MKLPNVFEKPENLKRFAAGETIFEAGQAPDFMYVVKTGMVDLYKDGHLLETVGPDGFFGELALVDNSNRAATAKAQSDCALAPINEKQFLFMVGETPFFALDIMRGMAVRLRRA